MVEKRVWFTYIRLPWQQNVVALLKAAKRSTKLVYINGQMPLSQVKLIKIRDVIKYRQKYFIALFCTFSSCIVIIMMK
jgi:hypothetical protein